MTEKSYQNSKNGIDLVYTAVKDLAATESLNILEAFDPSIFFFTE